MSDIKQLDVSIMGREFRVGCPADEEASLLQAVDLLNQKMQEIRTSGKIVGIEKIAIMAALNIAHEFLQVQVGGSDIDIGAIQRRINAMDVKIDAALNDQHDLF